MSEIKEASSELLLTLYNSMREDILPLRNGGSAEEADYLETRTRLYRAELSTRPAMSLDDLYMIDFSR